MIAGLVMLGIIVVKLLVAVLTFVLILNYRYRTFVD
jgi:hypothetical protein